LGYSQTDDTCDILHDVFIDVVRAVQGQQIRKPNLLAAYVVTITRRRIAKHIGWLMRERTRSVQIDEDVMGCRVTQEHEFFRAERVNLVVALLEEMRPLDREVLVRFYVHSHSPERICEEMHLTETQFRLLKSRAKARLAKLARTRFAKARLSSATLFLRHPN
jgi:RNA polymerase sigma factor (sigma-70 family)